jgi:hypothetical protein
LQHAAKPRADRRTASRLRAAQLRAHPPKYVFSGDSAPGDVNGEGVLGKWFAVRTDGTLLMNPSVSATPTTSVASPMGYGY